MYEFKLPDLGEGIHEGEILKWHVAIGDTVAEDAELVDVETDKAAVTIPSPAGGTVISQAGGPGDVITVGQIITVIDDGGNGAAAASPATAVDAAVVDAPPTAKAPAATPPATAPPTPAPAAAPPAPGRTHPVPAAPATRRLARELGVDINLAQPTGPGGRVTPKDVQRLAAGEVSAPPAAGATVPDATAADASAADVSAADASARRHAETQFGAQAASAIPFLDIEAMPDFEQWGTVERESLRSIRRKVARKMVTSMILVPHVAHMDEADVTELEEFRLRERERRGGEPGSRLTLLPFVVKAITAGLRAAPAFNASLDPFQEEIIYKHFYNIGIAVDTGHGLIVPVIKETDRKSVIQISRDIEDVAVRAREGKVALDELRGGTFTITNVGPIGGTALIPTINYPEVAILGMGRVQEKPVVRDGEIVVRKILPLTLSFDHRIADGADAARFVAELVRQLSDPNLLLLET